MKYVDPDGESVVGAILLLVASFCAFSLKGDKTPVPKPVDINKINNSLEKLFYNDGNSTNRSFKNPNTVENSGSLLLDSNPIVALGAAMPRGSYTENDYDNPNQMKGNAVETVSTLIGAASLLGGIVENLSEGCCGDVKMNYTKSNGKMTGWNISYTSLDPVTSKSTKIILNKDQAIKYLNQNKEYLKNTEACREISNMLD